MVVLLSEAPRRDEIAARGPCASVLGLRAALQRALQVPGRNIHHHHLVACDNRPATPEDVAACSARLMGAARGAILVVCLNDRVRALCQLAGLEGAGVWHPDGPPVVTAATFDQLHLHLQHYFGETTPKAPQSRAGLPDRARQLLAVLGKAGGSRVRHQDDWRTRPATPLTLEDVRRHLAGGAQVGVFRPVGAWPWLALDVDRHDAIQTSNFDDTVARLRGHFPGAFLVNSSESGGVHVYVRLPPETTYETGALVLRAHLLTKNLRFASAPLETGNVVRTELVEVKNHPPRLPFGLGSAQLDSPHCLADQLDAFVRWANTAPAADFERARDEVRSELGLGPGWGVFTRHRLRNWALTREVGRSSQELASTDPWAPLLPQLPPHLRAVASAGVPAYGTRTHWTQELVVHLVGLVDMSQAERLMDYWIRARRHSSADIEEAPDVVRDDVQELVKRTYLRARGLPASHWRQIEHDVRLAIDKARRCPEVYPHLRAPHALVTEEVLATAFFVALRFYRRGVCQRRVSVIEFAEFAGRNRAHDVQEVLSWDMSWLSFQQAAVVGRAARIYQLRSPALTPEASELKCPPFQLPKRRYWLGPRS